MRFYFFRIEIFSKLLQWKKMLAWIFSSLFLCCPIVVQADIYKWTDNNGNVHFSDQPRDGAKKIEIPDAQTYEQKKETSAQQHSLDQQNEETKSDKSQYQSIAILKPQKEDTVRDNEGIVEVLINVEPTLKEGDQLVVLLDGKPIGEPQTALNFNLKDIDRGAHTLDVQVVDANMQVIIASEQVTFYMHRAAVGILRHGK